MLLGLGLLFYMFFFSGEGGKGEEGRREEGRGEFNLEVYTLER